MKKNKIFILIFLVLFWSISISCSNYFDDADGTIFYWPGEYQKKITKKVRMKSFDNLECPIVVAMPFYVNHNLLGIEKWGSTTWQIGNILVVFDTKTEMVYDWAFTKGSCGWNDYQMVPIDKSWWISGSDGKTTKLDACTGEITVYEHGIESHIICNNAEKNTFLLMNNEHYDVENDIYVKTISSFDICTNRIKEEKWVLDFEEDEDISQFMCDFEGNFWSCSTLNNKKYLIKLSPNGEVEKIEIREDWTDNKKHSYNVLHVDNNCVFIHAHDYRNEKNSLYPCMLKYDINSHTFIPIDISSISSSLYNLYEGITVNGNCYFICLSEEIGDNLRLGLYNPEKQSIELIEQKFAYNYTGWPYACGTKIFLLDWWNTQNLKYEWYDTQNGESISPKTITLDEILKM